MAEKSRLIDGTLLTMLGLLLVLAGLAWMRGGSQLVLAGLSDGTGLLLRFLPLLVVSFVAAGFAELLAMVSAFGNTEEFVQAWREQVEEARSKKPGSKKVLDFFWR